MKRFGWTGVVLPVMLAGACSAGPAPGQTAADQQARQLVEACRGEGDWAAQSACYDSRLGEIAKGGEVGRALEVLEALAEQERQVFRDGHMFVHAVGIAAYDPERDFAEIFKNCTELFHAGCYHGLIQAHFAAQGEVDAAAINAVCDEVAASGADRWTTFQCLHGIGHGLVILHQHNLLMGLEGCDQLDDPWSVSSCQGGAFMENVTNATHPHHAALTAGLDEGGGGHDAHGAHGGHTEHAAAEPFAPIDESDPHYPCTIVAEHQKAACYGMQTAVILHLNGHDFAAAAVTCDDAPLLYRAICHSSLGRDASGFVNRDVHELNRLCSLDKSVEAPFCYVGAAKAVIDWAGQPADGIPFCEVVEGRENRLRCFQAVGQQIAVMLPDADQGAAVCQRVSGDEQQACLFGAGLTLMMPEALRAIQPGG